MAVVVKTRICRQCGASFEGGPRAWYCPDCRAIRRKESAARRRAKGLKADRPLGSIDYCTRCGGQYVVKNARQKYCPECAHDALREIDRQASREWNQSHKDTYYPAKNAKRNAERKANPEMVRKKEREYWARNPEKMREKNRRYREKKKGKL